MSIRAGMMHCDLCGKFAKEANAVKLGWTWFTGYNKTTTHVCGTCQERDYAKIQQMVEQAYQKPAAGVSP